MSKTNVNVFLADQLEDMKASMRLSKKLASEIEDMSHQGHLMDRSAEYYYNNKHLGSIVLIKDNETGEVVGKNVLNLQFSVERNEIINGPNSLYIEEDYRNVKNSSRLKNFMTQMNVKNGLKYFYGYFMGNNLNAKAIYVHWGMTLREELEVYCADFVLRKDPVQNKFLDVKQNLEFFKNRLLTEYEKGVNKNIMFKIFDQLDYEEIKNNHKDFKNILNKNWNELNIKGLKTLAFNEEIRKRNIAFTIKFENEIIGIVTTHRGFNEWRAGNWCWMIAFYMNTSKVKLTDEFIRNIMIEIQKFVLIRGINYYSARENYNGKK